MLSILSSPYFPTQKREKMSATISSPISRPSTSPSADIAHSIPTQQASSETPLFISSRARQSSSQQELSAANCLAPVTTASFFMSISPSMNSSSTAAARASNPSPLAAERTTVFPKQRKICALRYENIAKPLIFRPPATAFSQAGVFCAFSPRAVLFPFRFSTAFSPLLCYNQ